MWEFDGASLSGSFDWILPPSKSHIIRWLALCSQGQNDVRISFSGIPGEDSFSMARCLASMGSEIDFHGDNWFVCGKRDGLFIPDHDLQCGNSGTTANVISAMSACLDGTAIIDGDDSLRRRKSRGLCEALVQLGCEVSNYSIPRKISGKICLKKATLDWGETSQGASAMVLASPNLESDISLSLRGLPVSLGYWELTKEICLKSGIEVKTENGILNLTPWEVNAPSEISVYGEQSLSPMGTLFSRLHDVDIRTNRTEDIRGLGLAIRNMESGKKVLNLKDASDIITPSAAIMALGSGGRIIGCPHARGKESDRISMTVRMLGEFGIKTQESDDGIIIPGNQTIRRPENPVETYSDHRMAMTAMILASKVGGDIEGPECVSATDSRFVQQLEEICG